MHVFDVFPSVFCGLLVVDYEGFVVFVDSLCSGEELCGLGTVCAGGAFEGGKVLAKGLRGVCYCGDGGVQRDDS